MGEELHRSVLHGCIYFYVIIPMLVKLISVNNRGTRPTNSVICALVWNRVKALDFKDLSITETILLFVSPASLRVTWLEPAQPYSSLEEYRSMDHMNSSKNIVLKKDKAKQNGTHIPRDILCTGESIGIPFYWQRLMEPASRFGQA